MGNCQAVDAAALVIQHPNGRIQRMYWSITASQVMKMNPGHYVSLIIPLPEDDASQTVRFTRVKLLRPTDTLVLGRAYRLITTNEVMKVVRAKKHAKMKNKPPEDNQSCSNETVEDNTNNQVEGHERMFRQRSGSSSSILAASRSKSWRPSLQSIYEATT
ncbi:hypothetical protein M8C21_001518 [Ambrosia artemisiifolia]|uniref:DUF4228 domain-containing protein n=1 Tax=Ambrosia artemisiifolia TaxID=4212 RepID=A0AAD5DDX2_AMBAR|nr:hypothetical protein M8C21_001518 [Ambrosia artemisiifolia]